MVKSDKIGTWWHPSSNVKVEKYRDGSEKYIPLDLDGWTRTNPNFGRSSSSVVEIGRQVINEQKRVSEQASASVWKLLWDFFFGWLKK